MAGDWIKMRSNLWDDPRVSNLCDLLDCGEAHIVGALYWLWAAADQHTEDGLMPGLSIRQIDRKTGVEGFAQALCDIGWMELTDDGIRIIRFEEHNGTTAKKRAVTAKRVANHRGKDDVTHPALQKEHTSVTPALAREREREEKEGSVPKGTGGAAAKPVEELTKDELWSAGKSLLEGAGMPKGQCGSFVGKLVKDYGPEVVVEAVRAAVVARPADPAEYLKACCMKTSGQRGPKQVRQYDSAEDTQRVLESQKKGTRMGVPEELRSVVAQITGRKVA